VVSYEESVFIKGNLIMVLPPTTFLGSAQPASIYRNVWLSVSADYKIVGEVVLTEARVAPGSTVQVYSSWWSKQSVCALHVYTLPSTASW
jgi:hypothetical protein